MTMARDVTTDIQLTDGAAAHTDVSAPASATAFDYLAAQRHILLDMHVPDWNERLLAEFDASAMVENYSRAKAQAVMIYCNSHVGLCYWPTKVGAMHRALGGRDAVGDSVSLLHERGIATCAYYSLNFNNWAYHAHPEWRLVAAAPGSLLGGEGSRYGICCPNNPDYQAFQVAQVHELMDAYAFDAFFFDMMFWTDVCVCQHCRTRWAAEQGERTASPEIPHAIDWFSPEWCRFQTFRERSLERGFAELAAAVKSHRDVPVFLNGAPLPWGWRPGLSQALLDHCDLLGGDYLGPNNELFGYGLLMAGLTPSTFQYMNAFTGYTGGSSELKSLEEQIVQHALPAALFGGQHMAIDAIEPDGRVNPAAYEQLGEVFSAMAPFQGLLSTRPIADVAVYWSLESQVDFAENGTPLSEASFGRMRLLPPLPHVEAVNGAAAAARGRLPVGVITRKDLADLADHPLIVLPNLLRMDSEEIAAIRKYVAGGGKLLASGYTSLVDTDGIRHEDFQLADLFGCHFVGEDTSAIGYARPLDPSVVAAIAPLGVVPFAGTARGFDAPVNTQSLLVRADEDAEVLVALTRPYGEGRGSKDDEAWASIHAAPPFEDTDQPVVVRHRFGKGEVIYVAGDLDACSSRTPAARALVRHLMQLLLPAPPTFELDGDEAMWAVGYRLADGSGIRVALLNRPDTLPARRSNPVTVRLHPGRRPAFNRATLEPAGTPVTFDIDDDGRMRIELDALTGLTILEVRA
jgi:hypothetical protein